MKTEGSTQGNFHNVVSEIGDIGRDWHGNTITDHAEFNRPYCKKGKSIKQLEKPEGPKADRAIVVSAGPSLHRLHSLETIKNSDFDGSIICVDGSYMKALRAGVIPDYVVSLDPHPTRMVRWYGDPNFEKNSKNDDFFNRQDLDITFRNNSILENQKNIDLVNKYAPKIKLILATSAPKNVVERAHEAGFDIYWWNPLVDDPNEPNSLTRKLYGLNPLPCINTGGQVGSAAWNFTTTRLKIQDIGMVGMDMGYHIDTPYNMTQTWYELVEHVKGREDDIEDYFQKVVFPLNGTESYIDPTYFWYRRNLLEMMSQVDFTTYNCTESGTLFGPGIECVPLVDYLQGTIHG